MTGGPDTVTGAPLLIDVAVRYWPLVVPDAARTPLISGLDDPERGRLARLREGALRDAYLSGRGMMRVLLAEQLGCAPREVPISTTAEGKPFIASDATGGPDVRFNLSHAGSGGDGIAVLCVSEGSDVGIDVEPVRPVRPGLAKRYFAAEEADWAEADMSTFFALWTAKEACLKAWGKGIQGGLDGFVFEPPAAAFGTWAPVRVPEAAGPREDWQVVRFPVGRQSMPAAVAVRAGAAEKPFDVRLTVDAAAFPIE